MNCSCGKAAARDCENDMCGDCCPGCDRHPKGDKCENCGEYYDYDACEQCYTCENCCDCVPCGNCGTTSYDRRCDSCWEYCDVCDGINHVAVGIGYVCAQCAAGLSIGGIDNMGPEENW